MECDFVKTNAGLIPANDTARDWFAKVKLGRAVRGNFVQPRNPVFHAKFFALMNVGFGYFEETAPPVTHNGVEIKPDFERFRKDSTILAGKDHFVTNIKGEVRAEADSISFASMDSEEFETLYNSVLQVLMTRVLKGSQWSKERINEAVEAIAGFA